jgi:2-oxoglutarate/2-oxoacid ferredoxin oxidoreductase subunit beta
MGSAASRTDAEIVRKAEAVSGAAPASATTTTQPGKFITPDIKPVWCPGCGSYGVLGTLRKVLQSLHLAPENVMLTSGIGCSSRLAAYMGTYGFHTVHGRALPVALGAHVANPDLTHIVVGGDGDIFSIGGGHLPHVARRNPNITVLVLDNEIYGLTKGQASPTSPAELRSKSMPNRLAEQPLNPALMCLAYDVSFFARAYALKIPQLLDILTQAIRHPGLSVVQILNPCVTFNNMKETWDQKVQPIPEEHVTSNRLAAMSLAMDEEHLYTGVFYQSIRPTMMDTILATRERTAARIKPDLDKLIQQYA